jgi:hypothetical protein
MLVLASAFEGKVRGKEMKLYYRGCVGMVRGSDGVGVDDG